MRTSRRTVLLCTALVVTLGVSLAGCGSSSTQASAGASAKKKATHLAQARDPADRPPTDMVSAVGAGKSGPPVGLKFELRGLPQVGQPLDVDIAILPDAPTINRIFGKFQAGEGLELVEGGEIPQVEKPAPGSVIRHVVRVLPAKDGIFTLNATVSVDLSDDSLTRVFSIPVMVGDPTAQADVPAGQTAPETDSKTH
jgi:hypothetical protein